MTGDNLNETCSADMTLATYIAGYSTIMGNKSTEFFALYLASNDTKATLQSAAFSNDVARFTT